MQGCVTYGVFGYRPNVPKRNVLPPAVVLGAFPSWLEVFGGDIDRLCVDEFVHERLAGGRLARVGYER